MHDFDIARHERNGKPRQFLIAGQTFTFRSSVGADQLADYYDTLSDPETPGFNRRVVAAGDALILAWLEPGQDKEWLQVRSATSPDPLSITDIQEVIQHMTGVMTGRDLEQPSVSSSTPSQRGTISTDGSSSTEAPSPA